MNIETNLEYEAATRAGLWDKTMAVQTMAIIQRERQADRDRRFRYVVLAAAMLMATIIATCSACGGSAKEPAWPEPVAAPTRTPDQQDESAVRIESACVAGDVFAGGGTLKVEGKYGSGVVLATDTVLTVAHVVACDGARIVHVVTKSGVKYEAQVAHFDASRDYARLRVRGLAAVGTARIGSYVQGEEACIAAAHPYRGRACGKFLRRDWIELGNGTVDLWTSARVVPGNSGSGIYNAAGELVGLATNKIPCITDPWRDDCGGLGTSLAGRVK